MPRLSMYKPEKGNNYKFIDHHISQMFQVGGTDVYLHKYLGPKTPTDGTADQPQYEGDSVTNIQDLLFLEIRDRKYDTGVYRIRGIYNVQNIDFNLSQFGLFIDNDTIFMTVHINDFINYIGRKPISGDVMEMPHLRDTFQLGDADIGLPRYYVIEDVGRASEGFSATWYPHLYRLKLKKMSASQQYDDILNKPTGEDADKFVGEYEPGTMYYTGDIVKYQGILYQVIPGFEAPNGTYLVPPDPAAWAVYGGNTLEDILSTRQRELQINDAVVAQAEADAPLSGYNTQHFYTLAVDPETGKPLLQTADLETLDASNFAHFTDETNSRPARTSYTGYLVGDGIPPNGYNFGHGIQFPENPDENDYFLRTDFMPNRLFKFDNSKSRWVRIEDAVRMTMTNNSVRATQKTSFINNDNYIYNEMLAVDYIRLTEDDIVFDTDLDPITAKYLVLKLNEPDRAFVEMSYVILEHALLISTYTNANNETKIRITLPVVTGVQQTIPESGVWKVSLCDHREAQRQGLSTALRPRATLQSDI